ncbi:MAG: UDP-N-acetylmuramate dehydrogenase [Candidatus Omnitrophica bacterium]|nr:UDP-N-acetylmuramate dehydrogenase [Candidatus Omnitrophota bacterium]
MSKIIKRSEPLNKHTTLKCGGKAAFFAWAQGIDELKLLLGAAEKNKLPVRIIGAGSNILAVDKLKRSLVIKLSGKDFEKLEFIGNRVYAGAAMPVQKLILRCRSKGLGGLEFLSGIPASVGGALAMNAGAWGENTSNLVECLLVMDYNGKIRNLERKNIKFSYRNSGLKKYIILGCSFLLKKKSPKEISRALKSNMRKRRLRQDLTNPSAGCIFKNPQNDYAGRLIESCGLKGKQIGGAQISERHANFIINKDNAKSSDILKLIKLACDEVRKEFGIKLEMEIEIWR